MIAPVPFKQCRGCASPGCIVYAKCLFRKVLIARRAEEARG